MFGVREILGEREREGQVWGVREIWGEREGERERKRGIDVGSKKDLLICE